MARKTDNPDRPERGERIAKAIARAGLASRREAEDWIAAGRVAVNGKVIDSPALNVTANDRVTVDGEALPARERTRLFLYHKPRRLVTTHADPEGRPTIFGALPKNLPRLLSIGRVTQQQLDALREGITVDGIHYGPIEATLDREQGANIWLTFAIREGKNREVRNVLGTLGLQVNRLIRVSFGPFQLGELAEGAVEEVRTRVLRDQLGHRVIAEAQCDFSAPIVDRPAPAAPAADRRERRERDEHREHAPPR